MKRRQTRSSSRHSTCFGMRAALNHPQILTPTAIGRLVDECRKKRLSFAPAPSRAESGCKSLRNRFALIFGSSRKAMSASGSVSEHDPECYSGGCSGNQTDEGEAGVLSAVRTVQNKTPRLRFRSWDRPIKCRQPNPRWSRIISSNPYCTTITRIRPSE